MRAQGIRRSIGLVGTGWLLMSCPLAAAASEVAGAATQPTPTPAAATAPEAAAPKAEAAEPKASQAPKIASCAEWKASDAEARSSFLRSRAVVYTEGRQETEGKVVRACVDGRSSACIRQVDKVCRKGSSGDLEGVVEDCLDDCEVANYGKFYYHLVVGGGLAPTLPENKAN